MFEVPSRKYSFIHFSTDEHLKKHLFASLLDLQGPACFLALTLVRVVRNPQGRTQHKCPPSVEG
jgi:hypothetical protein